jgi:hypothetical protein
VQVPGVKLTEMVGTRKSSNARPENSMSVISVSFLDRIPKALDAQI